MSAKKWSGLILLVLLLVLGVLSLQQWRATQVPPADPQLPLPEALKPASEQPAPAARFVDITEMAGIDFVRNNGAAGMRLLPETMGGGVAFVDFDNDGLSDLLFADGGDWPDAKDRKAARHRLYRNLGDGRFEDWSTVAGLTLDFYAMGLVVADYDADGWMDLLITGVGGTRLLRNENARFVDVSAAAGVLGEASDWSTAGVFFDADNDGDLDLYVANYVQWSPEIDLAVGFQLAGVGRAYGPPMNFAGSHPRLYLQTEPGQFTEVSESAGMRLQHPRSGAAIGKGLGVVATDVNDDGLVDLMVANDTVRNFLYLNRGDAKFEEVGAEWGVAFDRDGNATGAMGIDSNWIGPEPRHAFLLGNFANEMSALYVAQPVAGLYSDDAIIEGLGPASRQVLTFGALFFDYDLDGRLDLLQTNGHIEAEIAQVQASQHYRQPGQLFWNCGSACALRFVELGAESMGDLATPMVGRGSAYGDLDNDGDLDLVITGPAGAPLLLRNDSDRTPRWIAVRLRAKGANRDALGARLSLHSTEGIQRREMTTSRGYLSAVAPILHFGWAAEERLQRLELRWPDGEQQMIAVGQLKLGQMNLIVQGGGADLSEEVDD